MKKLITFLLIFALVGTFFAGCGDKKTETPAPAETPVSKAEDAKEESKEKSEIEGSSGEGKTITVWAWDKTFNGFAIDEAVKVYSGEATIDFVEMGKADALQKIHTTLASGVTDDLPEIVLISDLQVPGYLMSYPGAFRPMDDVINYDDFANYKYTTASYNNVGYGVPFDSGVAGLFYRTDYMEEIGYTKEMMDTLTWNEYLELGPKLKEKGHLLQTFNPNDIAEFQIMLQSAGSWYTQNDEANFINNAVLEECFSIFKRLNDSDFVKIASDWSEFVGAINGGDVAAVLRGSWISASIMEADDQKGKWAVAPVPTLNTAENATEYSNQGGSTWFVLNNSENADLAATFLGETFGQSVELYDTLLSEKNIIPTFLPAQAAPSVTLEHEFYGGQKVNEDFATWLEEIPAVDVGSFSIEAQSALAAIMPQFLVGEELSSLLEEATTQYEQTIQ